jgi:voltage-gated potassium channel
MTVSDARGFKGRWLKKRPARRRWVSELRGLYEGESPRSHRFRLGLLAFDIATVFFIVGTSFLPRTTILQAIDIVIGLVLVADLGARLAISRNRFRELIHPATWLDVVAILSFLAPIAGGGAAFLRILRTLRVLYTYKVLTQLGRWYPFIRRNEQLIRATLNLSVFLFVMTGIVYETQHWTNQDIGNYADALYFTVTALTTTGFGDITLPGTTGRMISVIIMIFGVTLFLRLAAVLFRPDKVEFSCPNCGLQRHDHDAVHCKACGNLINIPDEGAV